MNNRAFSLIELMVVIAIVAVLSAVALPAYKLYSTKAKFSGIVTLSESYRSKIQEYYTRTGNTVTSPADIGLPVDTDPEFINPTALPNNPLISKIRIHADQAGRVTIYIPVAGLGITQIAALTEIMYSFRMSESNGALVWSCFFGGGSNVYLGPDALTIQNPYIPLPPCTW